MTCFPPAASLQQRLCAIAAVIAAAYAAPRACPAMQRRSVARADVCGFPTSPWATADSQHAARTPAPCNATVWCIPAWTRRPWPTAVAAWRKQTAGMGGRCGRPAGSTGSSLGSGRRGRQQWQWCRPACICDRQCSRTGPQQPGQQHDDWLRRCVWQHSQLANSAAKPSSASQVKRAAAAARCARRLQTPVALADVLLAQTQQGAAIVDMLLSHQECIT